MLRIRRSVQATYNTQVNFMASQMLKVSGSATGTGEQQWPPLPPGLPWAAQSPVLGPVGPASALSLALISWVWEYQGPPLPPRSETGNSLKSRALGTGEDIRQLVWLWE